MSNTDREYKAGRLGQDPPTSTRSFRRSSLFGFDPLPGLASLLIIQYDRFLMPISKTTFSNPPAVEVKAAVQFPNTLRVADDRAAFHGIIKAEFPLVVMPDQKQLQYDFGDYAVWTENQAYRIEISMNYFRLVAMKYRGFQDFRQMYLATLSLFTRHYGIGALNSFALQYINKLSLPPGTTLGECFAVKIGVPEELGVDLYAGRGLLTFRENDGFIVLEFNPPLLGSQGEADAYGLNLTFAVQRHLAISGDQNDVTEVLDEAHTRLTDFFFSILQPRVIEHLKTL